MRKYLDIFLDAIHQKKLVTVIFNSKEKGIITRKCVPFDFGPSKKDKSKVDKFHFWNIDSNHNLPVLPEQLINMEILNEEFNPADYIKNWIPEWNIKRDWGKYS